MKNNCHQLKFITLLIIIGISLSNCSTIQVIPLEKIDNQLPCQNMNKLVLQSSITGYFLQGDEYFEFEEHSANYNLKTGILTGTNLDGDSVVLGIDSLFAIKVKGIDNLNGINLKPKQFKSKIKLIPSNKYNPCWQTVIVKSNKMTIDTTNNILYGETNKKVQFNVPLSKIYSVEMKQKDNYKTIRYILSAVAIYALVFEVNDILY